MTFAEFNVRHLFPTPFVTASFAPEVSASINSQLAPMLLKKSEESCSMPVSSLGGWQSDDRLLEWGGEPVQKILDSLKELLMQITLHMEGASFNRSYTEWRINGWANVNRKGNMNFPHTHPGSYWSAVYYVQVDEGSVSDPKGGDLELLDPRGIMPIHCSPTLRFGIQGYTSAGTSETHKPKAGQCVIFPAWLTHAVRPYIGDGARISLAFNFAY